MSIVIPGITHLNSQEAEKWLGPVRYLRLFALRTSDWEDYSPRLLFHWNQQITDIEISHISRWIIAYISLAFDSEGLVWPVLVQAHEVRVLSASWAHAMEISLDD